MTRIQISESPGFSGDSVFKFKFKHLGEFRVSRSQLLTSLDRGYRFFIGLSEGCWEFRVTRSSIQHARCRCQGQGVGGRDRQPAAPHPHLQILHCMHDACPTHQAGYVLISLKNKHTPTRVTMLPPRCENAAEAVFSTPHSSLTNPCPTHCSPAHVNLCPLWMHRLNTGLNTP